MRIWSLHSRYLDAKGMVALWRETLLAQKVLKGQTKGYQHHPQLRRFLEQTNPLACIGYYLEEVLQESLKRGYRFDPAKIGSPSGFEKIPLTQGQLDYEWDHLNRKLRTRSPKKWAELESLSPEPHPLFVVIPGPIASWEVV